jgi:predicted small integral membrane protein
MTAPTHTETTHSPQSTFVTVVAWVFILISGFSTFVSALQNFMFRSMPFDQLDAAFQDSTFTGAMPASARALFGNFQFILLAFFLIAVLTLIASVGLLRRRNWARILFMGILAFDIACMLAGMVLQNSLMSSFGAPLQGAEGQDSTYQQFQQQFASMITVMRIATTILSLGMSAVLGWILVKLSSPQVRAEFAPRSQAA